MTPKHHGSEGASGDVTVVDGAVDDAHGDRVADALAMRVEEQSRPHVHPGLGLTFRRHQVVVARAPLVTDSARWRRVVVQASTAITFWQMDDMPLTYQAAYDTAAGTIALKRNNAEAGSLSFEQAAPERLVLSGTVEGRVVQMETTRLDHTKFLLLTRGFRWVQEFPFNR